MKIAISAEGPDLKAKVGERLGTSRYLIVIDLLTMAVEAVPNPESSAGSSAGMLVVAQVISKKVNAVLTGYCSPKAEHYLSIRGVKVYSGLGGMVGEVAEQFKSSNLSDHLEVTRDNESMGAEESKRALSKALRRSYNQFINQMPILLTVLLLMGLLNACLSKEVVSVIFFGNKPLDTILGACVGSIFAGNPINSYIIGGELLGHGVSLLAVTALIIAWVTVGLIQLPAEIGALGRRFALLRNALSFVLSIMIAFVTVGLIGFIG